MEGEGHAAVRGEPGVAVRLVALDAADDEIDRQRVEAHVAERRAGDAILDVTVGDELREQDVVHRRSGLRSPGADRAHAQDDRAAGLRDLGAAQVLLRRDHVVDRLCLILLGPAEVDLRDGPTERAPFLDAVLVRRRHGGVVLGGGLVRAQRRLLVVVLRETQERAALPRLLLLGELLDRAPHLVAHAFGLAVALHLALRAVQQLLVAHFVERRARMPVDARLLRVQQVVLVREVALRRDVLKLQLRVALRRAHRLLVRLARRLVRLLRGRLDLNLQAVFLRLRLPVPLVGLPGGSGTERQHVVPVFLALVFHLVVKLRGRGHHVLDALVGRRPFRDILLGQLTLLRHLLLQALHVLLLPADVLLDEGDAVELVARLLLRGGQPGGVFVNRPLGVGEILRRPLLAHDVLELPVRLLRDLRRFLLREDHPAVAVADAHLAAGEVAHVELDRLLRLDGAPSIDYHFARQGILCLRSDLVYLRAARAAVHHQANRSRLHELGVLERIDRDFMPDRHGERTVLGLQDRAGGRPFQVYFRRRVVERLLRPGLLVDAEYLADVLHVASEHGELHHALDRILEFPSDSGFRLQLAAHVPAV